MMAKTTSEMGKGFCAHLQTGLARNRSYLLTDGPKLRERVGNGDL